MFMLKTEVPTSLEPEQTDDTTEANVIFEDIRDPHTSVQKLLSTLIRDGRNECGGFTNDTEFLLKTPLAQHIRGKETLQLTCAHL